MNQYLNQSHRKHHYTRQLPSFNIPSLTDASNSFIINEYFTSTSIVRCVTKIKFKLKIKTDSHDLLRFDKWLRNRKY